MRYILKLIGVGLGIGLGIGLLGSFILCTFIHFVDPGGLNDNTIPGFDRRITDNISDIADLDSRITDLEAEQPPTSLLTCYAPERLCVERGEELNEHGLPGRAWTKVWCCP